uniref:Phospholipase A2 n=1 Tax=Chrysolophus pictus TaxID=9089 RepID=A0A8C3LKC3_CHRPC
SEVWLDEQWPTLAMETTYIQFFLLSLLYASGSLSTYVPPSFVLWLPYQTFCAYVSIVSQSDCYVSLWLPTASDEKFQTKTIKNCKDPVWNETFYFRIQRKVKVPKVLISSLCSFFWFKPKQDVNTSNAYLSLRKVLASWSEHLWLLLLPSSWMLFVCISAIEPDLLAEVRGSFEEMQRVSLSSGSRSPLPDPTLFHYAKYNSIITECCCKHDLRYLMLCSSHEDLDVRLGFDLCAQEQDFICKRKKVVAAALKDVLQLEEDLEDDEVPVVAIMTTGGGTRALTAMYAHLLSMQELNVLDCVSYVTGLSGTTWTMANLYEDPDWSQKNLKKTLNDIRRHVLKNKFLACFAPDRLKYYLKELCQRKQEGHQISFTDLWGLIIESMFRDKEDTQKLTDQQQALNRGQNPLPIYLSLNVKDKISDQDFREWVEFTPYEVGFLKYGAYIRAEDFGSEFFMGRLMKKIPESRICFLEGIWSSVFSLNLLDAWYISVHSEDFWHKWTRDKITDIDDETLFPKRPNELETRVVCPTDSFSDIFRDVVTLRPAASEIPNFLKGLQMNNNYLESEFSKWKDCELDSQPNHLTGAADYLILIDTAFVFATSYPPLMRPERKVDVILHFNYSSGSQTRPLKEASEYFAKQGIPFPKEVPDDQETPHLKECYIVGEKESPETPIVIFFPLVNDTFREYKAPGVRRSPSEMAEGDVDVTNSCGPYYINNLSYSEKDFDKLVNLSYYNVQNNKDLILQALRAAVERKKKEKQRCSSSKILKVTHSHVTF